MPHAGQPCVRRGPSGRQGSLATALARRAGGFDRDGGDDDLGLVVGCRCGGQAGGGQQGGNDGLAHDDG